MRALTTIIAVILLSISTGCSPTHSLKKTANTNGKTVLLTVDFNDTRTLRYKFFSARDITIDWEPSKPATEQGRPSLAKPSESLETVIAYTPVEINPYGLSTIQATCESVKVRRSDDVKKDAVEEFAGKTYRFKVGPTGKIEDNTELDKLIKQIGEKAFRSDTSRGRIKEPDMIADFIATQWFLWDSVSSIPNPSEGVRPGQSWQSQLSVPTPMVMRKARDVTYTLEEIRESEKGRLAVISSTYDKAESVPNSWPIPYSGRFQMSGPFGFYRNYKILSLHGEGEEIFNIDAGRIDKSVQHYIMNMSASLLMPLPGVNPRITIKQYLTMELLGN